MKLSTIVLGLATIAAAQEAPAVARDLGHKKKGYALPVMSKKAPTVVAQQPSKKGHVAAPQPVVIPTVVGTTHIIPSKKGVPVRTVPVQQVGKGGFLRNLGRKRGGWGGKKGGWGYAAPKKAQPVYHSKKAAAPVYHSKKAQPVVHSKKQQAPVYVVQQQVSKQIPVIPQIATYGKKGHGY